MFLGYCDHMRSMTVIEENQYTKRIHSLMEDLSTFITKRNEDIDNQADTVSKLNMSDLSGLYFQTIFCFTHYEN